MRDPSRTTVRSSGWLAMLCMALVACNTPIDQNLEPSVLLQPGTYVLTAMHSGKVLDVPNANAQTNASVWQYDRNDTTAQQWRVEAVDGSHVKISSMINGHALTADPPANGGSVTLQPYSDAQAKHWLLYTKPGGQYEIVNRASKGALAIAAASTAAQAKVNTGSRSNAPHQRWLLERASSSPSTSAYQQNMQLIRAATVRNRNHDNSSFRDTPMAKLPTADSSPLLGSRSDYIRGDDGVVPGAPAGNPEPGFPAKGVGTFRTGCEFSHFAYDDPLVHPGKPGAAHLHMFWGNTDANALSTYDTLKDSGGGTCNGMELNRTGYWAPAVFDAQGNVRVPERIIVYYKGYGLAQGTARPYPPKAAMVMDDRIHRTSHGNGGAEGDMNFYCTNQYRGVRSPASLNIPDCKDDGSIPFRRVLEMHVKFANCWNGQDAALPQNWVLARYGSWYYSNCEYDGNQTFPNIHYLIAYPLEPGESTAGWYLSSDVDPTTRTRTKPAGGSTHADWWGGWHPSINKEWIDNCVNLKKDSNGDGQDDVDHGCGFGYLSDGGPDNDNPLPGRALKYRSQYTGPLKVVASTLYRELCPSGPAISTAAAAAHCTPSTSK